MGDLISHGVLVTTFRTEENDVDTCCYEEVSLLKMLEGKELEDGEDRKLQSNYTPRININGVISPMLLRVCYSVS